MLQRLNSLQRFYHWEQCFSITPFPPSSNCLFTRLLVVEHHECMQKSISKRTICFLPWIPKGQSLFAANVKYESSPDFHFLVLIVFKPQSINILLQPRNLGSIESSRLGVPGKNMLPNRKVGQYSVRARYCDQCLGKSLIYLARCTVLIWLRVLNLVS